MALSRVPLPFAVKIKKGRQAGPSANARLPAAMLTERQVSVHEAKENGWGGRQKPAKENKRASAAAGEALREERPKRVRQVVAQG